MSQYKGSNLIRPQPAGPGDDIGSLESALSETSPKRADLVVGGSICSLIDSEKRYRSLIEHISNPIWAVDRKYDLIKFNSSFCAWLESNIGVKAAEGINMLRSIKKDQRGLWKDLYEQAFAGGSFTHSITLSVNGSTRYYDLSINPVTAKDGSIDSLMIIGRDITEEKKDQLLKEAIYNISEASLSAFDLAAIGKIIHRELARLIDAACFSMTLYDERSGMISFPYYADNVRHSSVYKNRKFDKDIVEHTIRKGVPLLLSEKEIRSIRSIDHKKYFKAGTPKCWLGVPVRRNGCIAGMMMVLSYGNENAYTEKDLELLGSVAGKVGDILERKTMQEALVRSEACFRSLTGNTSDLIAIINENKEIAYVSNSAECILGYYPAEIIGKEFREYYKLHERKGGKKWFDKVLSSPGAGSSFEIEAVHKNGSTRVLELIPNNLLHDPCVRGVIVNANDITERKRYENILKQLSKEPPGVTGNAFFESLVSNLSHALDGDYVYVGELSDDAESIEAFAFYGEGRKMPRLSYKLRNSPCANLFKGKEGLCIHSSKVSSLFPGSKELKKLGAESYSGTILRGATGEAIGLLVVISKRAIQDVEVRGALVTLFGSRASAELERQRSLKRLDVLHKIDKAILRSRSIKAISKVALSQIEYFVRRFNRASVSLFDFKKQEVAYIAARARKRSAIVEGEKLPISFLRNPDRLRKGKPVEIGDLKKLKTLSPIEKKLVKEGLRSYILFPLMNRGELVGALAIGSNIPHFYRDQDMSGIIEIANQLALAVHDSNRNTALIDSEQKNRTILHAIPDMMFHFDKNGKFIGYKAEASQLAFPPAKFMDKTVHDVYEKPFALECLKCIRAAIRTREVQLMEYKTDNNLDKTKYYEARFIAGTDGDALCFIRDITDRKGAEIALKQSQRTYSTLVGNLPGMVYRCLNDERWTIRFVNEAAYALTGYEPGMFMSGKVHYIDIIHPDDRQGICEQVQQAIGQKTCFTLNYRIITASNEVKWVWEQGSGIFDDEGELKALEGFIIDITAQKESEQKLRFSDDILNRIGSLVIAGNSQGEISYVSPSVHRILGYKPEELKGKKWLELSSKVLSYDGREDGGIPQSGYVSTMVTKSGETRWISWEYSIASDGAIIGAGQDITLRREAEMQLVKSNEIISLIMESIDEVIYSVKFTETGKKKIEYISPQVKQVLGYSDDEYMFMVNSSRQSTWIHPDDLLPIMNAYEKLRQKISVVFAYRFKHKDTGEYVWVEETISPRVDENGYHIGNFGTMRDITERKRSEDELQLFNSVVQSTSEGILVTDPHQVNNPVIYANPAFCKITGYHPYQIYGQNWSFLAGRDTSQEAMEKLDAALKAGAPFEGELLNYKKDGTPFWNYLTTNPIFGNDGRLTHFVGVIKDVTERKDAEELLQEKNHEMNNFVYKASHDLKGPLASIIGVTNLAMTEVKDEYALKFVHFVNESTKRLDAILKDLLEISRVTHSSVMMEKVDVQKLAKEIIFSLRHAEHSRDVNFDIQVIGKNYIYTDRKIFMSILQNLIDNAIKYKNDRQPVKQVQVIVNDYKHGLTVEVKDNGVGIPDKLQAKVFDMFFRGSEKSKGTGLGLYIVKNSVKKLGGFVDYYSREMEGSSFNIYLPDMKKKRQLKQ